jgi:formyltetrahydrofolate-dependent phosphoribosylglycinamide formyltransferase
LNPVVAVPLRLAVLASGGGSNLQALLDRFPPGAASPVEVALVVGSRPGIGALARAHAAEIPHAVLGGGDGEAERLLELLDAHAVALVVLAGYLRLVPAEVVRRWSGRMINVHPALLPAFGGTGMYGEHVHQAVIRAGVCVSGATVHQVDEVYDRGVILAQWPVPVLPGDTAERLAARVLAVEHRLLPAVVGALASGRAPAAASGEADAAFRLAAQPAPPAGELLRLLAATPFHPS